MNCAPDGLGCKGQVRAKVRCGPERCGEWTSCAGGGWRARGQWSSEWTVMVATREGTTAWRGRGRDSAFAQWVGGRGRLQGSRVMV